MTSGIRTRTVAPYKFQTRRLSLGQELHLIANRSGEPDAGIPLSPVPQKKRSASVDNSRLDKCQRNIDDLCSSPRKAAQLPRPTTETNKSCSLPIKNSSLLLRRMASDGELKNAKQLHLPKSKLSGFITHSSSPLASNSSSSIRAPILTSHKLVSGIPSLEYQSSRRTSRTNHTMPKYTTARTAKLPPIPTNQLPPVRLSVSPVTFRDQSFNAFGGLTRFPSATPKGMATSPTDATRTVPPISGSYSRNSKNPTTPQNLQTHFFPVLGSYLPTNGTTAGYYFPPVNNSQGAYYSQLGNPVIPLQTAPPSNCRQYHQTYSTNSTYYPPYDEGFVQAGSYIGSLIQNNLSPRLPTQNGQFYYQIPFINSTNDCQYITSSSPTVYSQNLSEQAAWNYLNRMVSPNQTLECYNGQSIIEMNNTLPFSPSGDAIQRPQTEGTGISPSRQGQFVYQTPDLTLPIDNLLYPVGSCQSGYQANSDGLSVIRQIESLSSPKNRNSTQKPFPFLFSDIGLSPRKKITTLAPQTPERPGIYPNENQWLSNPLNQLPRPFH